MELRNYKGKDDYDSYEFSSVEEYRNACKKVIEDDESYLCSGDEEVYKLEVLINQAGAVNKYSIITDDKIKYLDEWLKLVCTYYPEKPKGKYRINFKGDINYSDYVPKEGEKVKYGGGTYSITVSKWDMTKNEFIVDGDDPTATRCYYCDFEDTSNYGGNIL